MRGRQRVAEALRTGSVTTPAEREREAPRGAVPGCECLHAARFLCLCNVACCKRTHHGFKARCIARVQQGTFYADILYGIQNAFGVVHADTVFVRKRHDTLRERSRIREQAMGQFVQDVRCHFVSERTRNVRGVVKVRQHDARHDDAQPGCIGPLPFVLYARGALPEHNATLRRRANARRAVERAVERVGVGGRGRLAAGLGLRGSGQREQRLDGVKGFLGGSVVPAVRVSSFAFTGVTADS